MNDVRIGVLKHDKFFVVSVEDWDSVKDYPWYMDRSGYVARTSRKPQKKVYLHRQINQTPDGMYTDHVNGCKHDCTRRNLRTCTNSQNQANNKLHSKSTSGYKGVSWFKADKVWTASIKVNQKKIHLGRFATKELAAEAYNAAHKNAFGEFAKLNPLPTPA
jgi:hypothetical protein